MKDEFVEYLESIGITEQIYHKRVEEILKFFSEICPEDVEDIFVNEHINEDRTRVYEDIDIFTKSYNLGAIQFLTKDNFTIMRNTTARLIFLKVKKEDYDFKTTTEKSRFNMECTWENKTSLNCKASGENCDYLKRIMLKYIMTKV